MGRLKANQYRVAFFGGSFDPPHLGHLAVAHVARSALGLDKVLFAPVGAQPLKPAGSTADFEDRVAMTRLAIAGELGFAVSLADAPKPGGAPNYTLETLQMLRQELSRESALYCLMGADSFIGLQRWHRAAEIPFVAPLIVASRPGEPLDDLKTMLPRGLTLETGAGSEPAEANIENSKISVQRYSLRNQEGERTPFFLLPGLDVEISASQIREWIRDSAQAQLGPGAGHTPESRRVLPESVAEYVRSHGLYR